VSVRESRFAFAGQRRTRHFKAGILERQRLFRYSISLQKYSFKNKKRQNIFKNKNFYAFSFILTYAK